MIMLSGQEDQFKTSAPNPHFNVTAPNSNPLVASLPVVVTKVKDVVEVSWNQEPGAGQRDSAESVLERLSNQAKRDTLRFPGSARAHANFGVALAKAERLDEAIAELEEAVSIEPNDYLAGVTLARVYVSKGDHDRARELYERLLRQYPKSDSILLSLAYIALRSNAYATAEQYLRNVLEIDRNAAFPHFLLGMTRLQMGNVHGAISALKEAARIDVRRSAFHHALGVAYAIAGDLKHAERYFRAALALSPDTPAGIYAISNVLLKRGQPASALELLRPYVETHPSDVLGRDLLAWTYFDLHKYGHARAQLEVGQQIAGEKMPSEERARFLTNIAGTLLREEKVGPAEATLYRAIELAPRWSSTPYENLALLRFRTQQWEKAIEVLESAKRLFPNQQSVRRLLAATHAQLDKHDLAISELRPLYQDGTAEAETSCALGSLYEWIGDYDSAISVLTEAHAQFPKTPGLINNLAYTYLMVGQVDAARSILSSLPRSVEPHAELIATQGLLRLWEGDRAQGRLFYEKAAQVASASGDRNLARRVRQKMYLELAKDSLRRDDAVGARLEIAKGLSIRPDANSFKAKLKELLAKL
jgi:tetratricopeptide (TPR) repeat protein